MPQNDRDTLVDLPQGLRRQFEQAAQRLWRVETATAAGGIAASLLFSWLAVFVSDRLWETPVWLRVVIFLCGLGGAAAAILAWARHWVWRRRDLRALAALVQKKYRRLGDRLLGIVELANEQEHLSNFSPALYHAAITQVAEEAEKFDFRQSVNARPAKNFGWTAAALALCLLAASLALPQASGNAFLRWIEPGANVPRYTLVVLDGFPREMVVPHGEPFEISGTVRYRSFWKPSRVLAGFGRQAGIQSAAQSGTVRLQIPGQMEEGVLKVRVGDALAQVAILPSHRPSLQQLSASIHWPDYLRYPDEAQPVQGGTFRALEGSRVSFVGTVSRPLAAASMQGGGPNPVPLKVEGPAFATEPAEAPAEGELVFNWRDQLGLTNASPWRLALQQESDQPPLPDLPDQPRTSAILAGDVMRIRAEAQDDFGVRELGLTWEVVAEAGQPESLSTEIKAELPSSQQKKVEDIFLWSPALYRIPADSTVELQGFAQDYFPKRARTRTGSYAIRVLSAESHAEMLRQDLEALMAQIEDVTRLQEKIVSDTREVKESTNELTGAQPFARLTQSHEEQQQNAQRLAELGRQGEDTVREAMKNSLIPEDTIRQWSQTLQQWQELSAEKMPEAARALMSAAQDAKPRQPPQSAPSPDQASPSPQARNDGREGTNGSNGGARNPQSPQARNDGREGTNGSNGGARNPPSQQPDAKAQEEDAKRLQQELAEAEKRAEEVLEALRKMEQNANQNLDQLQALTLAERLRKVGDEEKGLGGQLTTNLADTIGLPPQDLPEKFQRLNTAFVEQQGGAHDESAALQAEISRFFERTQKPNYGKVSQDMKETRAADELDRIGSLIQSNIAVQSTLDLANWSARFQKWADDLQPKQDPSQAGQSQSGSALDLSRQLIALLRLREKESTLRDQTGVLEWSKDNTADYKEQAGALAATQENLGQALALIHKATPLPALGPPFDQTAASMQEAQALLAKPQTDAVTDGTEARSVDELSDLINLINEQAQRGQQQQQQQQQQEQAGGASAEEMAFLTRLMRGSSQNGPPGMQPQGRGNLAGGTTDREGRPVTGDAGGRGAAGRIVNKAAGVIQNAPAEFRDALENYFHSVEKLKN